MHVDSSSAVGGLMLPSFAELLPLHVSAFLCLVGPYFATRFKGICQWTHRMLGLYVNPCCYVYMIAHRKFKMYAICKPNSNPLLQIMFSRGFLHWQNSCIIAKFCFYYLAIDSAGSCMISQWVRLDGSPSVGFYLSECNCTLRSL